MRTIPESELVLNSDGSIYHLSLRPEEVADTILTVGDPSRVARISSHFDTIEIRREKREFVTHTGRFAGKRLTVLSTGIGPDNIDIVINELDALVNIDLEMRREKEKKTVLNIIRIGTSGGLQPDIPVNSLIASRFGIGFDNLLRYYEYHLTMPEAALTDSLNGFLEQIGRLPVEPYLFQGSQSLFEAIAPNMIPGITITAPGFYGPQGRHLRLPPRLSAHYLRALANFEYRDLRITNFEMETSAIYGLARLFGHRALSCNVLLANRPENEFSDDPKASVNRLICEVLTRIAESELFD